MLIRCTIKCACVVFTIYHQIFWFLWRSLKTHLEWLVPGTSCRIQSSGGLTERNASAASTRAPLLKWHLMKTSKGREISFPQKECRQQAHRQFIGGLYFSIVHLNAGLHVLLLMCELSVKCMRHTATRCPASSSARCCCLSPCSLTPLPMSICRGCTGRSITLSPWLTRASFTTLNPFSTTIQTWPIRKLNTSPCFSASWKSIWHTSLIVSVFFFLSVPASLFYSLLSFCFF